MTMQLWGLNGNKQPVTALNCTNIQWGARYYEIGTFQLELRAQDWDKSIVYIWTEERIQCGIVDKAELQRKVQGDFVLVSGYFCEVMLNWKQLPEYKKTASLVTVIPELLVYAPGFVLPSSWYTISNNITVDVSAGANVGDTIYTALQAVEATQSVSLNISTGNFEYRVLKGADKSQTVSLGLDTGMILDLTVTKDGSSMKNYARVMYKNGTAVAELDVDHTGLFSAPYNRRHDLYIDTGRSIAAGQTQAQFEAELTAIGETELLNYPLITSVEAKMNGNQLVYNEDYFLGTVANVPETAITDSLTVRIVGMDEVWKENQYTATPILGNILPVRR